MPNNVAGSTPLNSETDTNVKQIYLPCIRIIKDVELSRKRQFEKPFLSGLVVTVCAVPGCG